MKERLPLAEARAVVHGCRTSCDGGEKESQSCARTESTCRVNADRDGCGPRTRAVRGRHCARLVNFGGLELGLLSGDSDIHETLKRFTEAASGFVIRIAQVLQEHGQNRAIDGYRRVLHVEIAA